VVQKPNVEFFINPESQYPKIDYKRLVRALEEKDSDVVGLIAGRHIMKTFNNLKSRVSTFEWPYRRLDKKARSPLATPA
jgi:hypothetical protein